MGDDDVDAKRSRPSIGKPVMGHARKERVLLFGTDQRITSGPAAKRPHSKAEYMTAPERFAQMSDSSCTAGAVHTWPIARATAAARHGRLVGSTCRALARLTLDDCDNLAHVSNSSAIEASPAVPATKRGGC